MIKYWKQWRAWAEQRMKDYEKQLVDNVVKILEDMDYSSLEYKAKDIINQVRHMDKFSKPW